MYDINENIETLKQLEDSDIVNKREKKNHNLQDDEYLYKIRLKYNNSIMFFKSKIKDIKRGDFVVVPTIYGLEMATCLGMMNDKNAACYQEELLEIVRLATEDDKKKHSENIQKEIKAFDITIEKIKKHNLDMKLINVHYFLDDSKILFNFTSAGRVDFRELVKDLASVFKTRIELRQIGVRDECRIINSYGQCGKHLCCANVLNELAPITIKMAKEQNITLNSSKISGICGRLLCCLNYENETYIEEKKEYPPEGSVIIVNNQDRFILTEINIQNKKLKITSEAHPEVFFYVFKEDLKNINGQLHYNSK